MLRFLRLLPLIFWNPDDPVGGVPVTEPAPGAPAAPAASPEAQPGEKTSTDPNALAEPDYKALLAKREKENARLALRVQKFQEREKGAKQEPSSKPDAPVDVKDHPLLAGLPRDEYGDVQLDGQSVSPALAVRLLEQQQALDEMRESAQKQQTAAQQAQYAQDRDEAVAGFVGLVSELADVALPGLDGDAKNDLQEMLQEQALVAFANVQQSEGGLTVQALQDEATRIVERNRRTFQALISKQLAGNSQYAENHPTKPDGQPGHAKPADRSQMSRTQLANDRAERVRIAEAKAAAR